MIYNLQTPLDQERFAARANSLIKKGAVVDLTEKTLRSQGQNSYLHLIIGAIAIDTGVTLAYAKTEYFKKLANADIFIRRIQDRFAGDIVVIRSTADLTVEEMTVAIDRFKRWSAEQGFYLPNPGDTDRLRDLEIEISRMRKYL